jgi:23S rRNA (cytosine1962-C5)-methyltransferase
LKALTLKQGREKSLRAHHPWVFSRAVEYIPDIEDGEIVEVFSSGDEFLGLGMCSLRSQITLRMLSFERKPVKDILHHHIHAAASLRRALFEGKKSNACRLINAEGDFLPGLIVDKFDDVLVMQLGCAGMEKIKDSIVEILVELLHPSWIYEKSSAASRKEEGLAPVQKTLFGVEKEPCTIMEEGLLFDVFPIRGQKTGFFLDQRSARSLVREYANGRRLLNCFSYTGAFTVAALAGGAARADSLDSSQEALNLVGPNLARNGFDGREHSEFCASAFDFLRDNPLDYDFIILDPPAFAKRRFDVPGALRGYKEINRLAIGKMAKGSFLLTSSCSYHVTRDLFQQMLFRAALDAGRNVQIIARLGSSPDHPLNVYHPEGEYLKSFLCYVQ